MFSWLQQRQYDMPWISYGQADTHNLQTHALHMHGPWCLRPMSFVLRAVGVSTRQMRIRGSESKNNETMAAGPVSEIRSSGFPHQGFFLLPAHHPCPPRTEFSEPTGQPEEDSLPTGSLLNCRTQLWQKFLRSRFLDPTQKAVLDPSSITLTHAGHGCLGDWLKARGSGRKGVTWRGGMGGSKGITVLSTTPCIKGKFSSIEQITFAANFRQGFWQAEEGMTLFLPMEIQSSLMLGSTDPSKMVSDRHSNMSGVCSGKEWSRTAAQLCVYTWWSAPVPSPWKQWEIVKAFYRHFRVGAGK